MDDNQQVNQNNGDQANQIQAPGWISGLPDEYKTNETLQQFKTVGDFAKYHFDETGKAASKVAELEGKLAGAILRPGEKATDEERKAYRASMGVPESPDDYEVALPEGSDDSLAKWFKAQAHELDIPKATAKELSARWGSMVSEIEKQAIKKTIEAHDEALSQLEKEWGPDAPANKEAIKKAYQTFGGDELSAAMQTEIVVGEKRIRVGDLPALAKAFLKIGKLMQPDGVTLSGPGQGQPTGTLDQQARAFYEKPGG